MDPGTDMCEYEQWIDDGALIMNTGFRIVMRTVECIWKTLEVVAFVNPLIRRERVGNPFTTLTTADTISGRYALKR